VTVSELQALLSDLSRFLRASGASAGAGELEYLGAKLGPFKDRKLKAFADFLEQAEAVSRGVAAPKAGGRPKKSKADPAAIEEAFRRTAELYGKAIDPSVTVEQIESAVQALQDLDPPKTRLDELARHMGYTQRFSAKADVIRAIRQKIISRKGAFERPNA
jgi:hypothetical protein